MPIISCSCGCSFKRSGIRVHQRQSKNPLCKAEFTDRQKFVSKAASSSHQAAAVDVEDVEIAIDPYVTDPYTSSLSTADSIHCHLERVDKRGDIIPGRFDTALINDSTGEETGIEGTFCTFPGSWL